LTVHLAISAVYVLTVFVGSWLVGDADEAEADLQLKTGEGA
jgi:hypothetical protein